MRWEIGRRSQNVEDRRGMGPAGFGRGVRVGGMGGLGILAVALIAMFLGVDPSVILNSVPMQQTEPAVVRGGPPPGGDRVADFVSAVLAQTEDSWSAIFAQAGRRYQEPQLVLFNGGVQSACGIAGSATGPFYCPGDQKLYIDLSFFDELDQRFGAPGDFAQAYVIAHEVGHHVQNLMGITDQMEKARARVSEREYNALSVRLELQADCFAGIWAHHNHKSQAILEPGDVEEALNAAAAIGDDALQRKSQGHVVPDSFTHGTSAQRQRWFNAGLQSGNVQSCDTFKSASL
jgi:predicted metalloprotease